MNLTIRENINKESTVLKHKIGLETITLLEDRGNILTSEIEIYAMVSLVDSFVNENLIQMITEDEREFAEIVEADIEPLFEEIIQKYEYKDIYDEIVEDIVYYKEKDDADSHSLLGLLNIFFNALTEQNWEDLQFFFNDMKQKSKEVIAKNINIPDAPDHSKLMEQGHKAELDGASEKIGELISKFQKINTDSNEEKR